MQGKEAILARRADCSLDKVDITLEIGCDLAECAGLTPSCFNHQPWRMVFVNNPETLEKLYTCLSQAMIGLVGLS